MSTPTRPLYRPDIDGLRAVSILATVLWHLNIPLLQGGFAAVDLFFVISGYVITRIIFTDINEGRFSLNDFYRRRMRRLLPALIVMLASVLVACNFLFSSAALLEFVQSLIATLLFGANFFFRSYSDYFSSAAELKPLLHCWTLAVEEQLYLVFPLLLLVLARKSRRAAIAGTIITLLVSLVFCIYWTQIDKPSAFYSMPARAWEFLIGAVIAQDVLPRLKAQWLRDALCAIGLLLIATAMYFLDEKSAFPGPYALWPVLGCALVIYAGNEGFSRAAAVLCWRPVVYLGRTSYSLYLWHWPLIAIANNTLEGELTLATKALIVTAALILSSLSYHFVEQPFRLNKKIIALATLRRGVGIAFLLGTTATASYLLTSGDQYNQPLHAAAGESMYSGLKWPCDLIDPSPAHIEQCAFGDIKAEKVFLLWGDSHALALFPAFDLAAKANGWRGIWVYRTGCPPLFDVYRLDGNGLMLDGKPYTTNCTGSSEPVRQYLRHARVDLVFLVSRWSMWESGWYVNGRLQQQTHFIADNEHARNDAHSSALVLKHAVDNTIRELSTERIATAVIGPVPILPRYIDKFLPDQTPLTRAEYNTQKALIERTVNKLAIDDETVRWIDITDKFCSATACMAYEGNRPLYSDDNHLTTLGALRLVDTIGAVLTNRH